MDNIKKLLKFKGLFHNGHVIHHLESYEFFLSRRLRKKLKPIIVRKNAKSTGLIQITSEHLWKLQFYPFNISFWVAVNFFFGSLLFAVGAIPGSFGINNFISSYNIGLVYFVGSLLFTLGGYLQFIETINRSSHSPRSHTRFFAVLHKSAAYLSSVTQLLGTIFFNISTWFAIQNEPSVLDENIYKWSPDFLGSSCFVISAIFLLAESYHKRLKINFRYLPYWIIWINFYGCLLFLVSSIFSVYLSSAYSYDSQIELLISNQALFFGSLLFMISSYLLFIELNEKAIKLLHIHKN